MFLFFKRSKVVVDAFTCQGSVNSLYPLTTANKCLPQWWKNTPKEFVPPKQENKVVIPGNTARRCSGIIDYYNKNNIVIPMWSDLVLEYGPQDWKYAYADGISVLLRHEQEMRGSYMPEYEHFKIASPWRIEEKSGIKFHYSQIFYNFDDPGSVLFPPAIVNYKYQHSTEINFMLRRPAVIKTFKVEAGQPLVMLTPLTEKEVVVKTHLISFEEHTQRFMWMSSFHGHYNKEKKILQEKEKKCPFRFK